MQAARDLVGGRVELAPGMQLGQHHLQRRHPLPAGNIHLVHRDPPAIVGHGDGIIDMNGDFDPGCVAGQRFIDGIIDHFVDQVVETLIARGPDIHRGTQPDSG